MNLKFWKKDDFSDYKLPPLGAENNLGLSSAHDGSGAGLDLTGGFQPSGNGMPSMPPMQGFGSNPSSFSGQGQFGMHDDDHGPGMASANQSALHGKDLEVIAAKLDAIKSQLDMLNLRISTIEQRIPQQQPENSGAKKPWY